VVQADAAPFHGFQHSVRLNLPPLSMLLLVPEESAPQASADSGAEAGA
jgi:hypothetical protein